MKINKRTSKEINSKVVTSKPLVSKFTWEQPLSENTTYVLKSSAYSYAELTSEVILPEDGIISFYIIPEDTSDINYILRSASNSSSIYFRKSDGRLRITTDDNNTFTFNLTNLPAGKPSFIVLQLSDNQINLYLDNEYFGTRSGPHTTISVKKLGEGITVFGVTVGNSVSYPLRADSPTINTDDTIGNNDLTFIDIKVGLESSDFIGVSGDY